MVFISLRNIWVENLKAIEINLRKNCCSSCCMFKTYYGQSAYHSFQMIYFASSFLKLKYLTLPFIFNFSDGATNIKSEGIPYNNLMGMDYQSLQQLASLVPNSQILNPIDRLYSMQSQYFCSENPQSVHHQHHQMCEQIESDTKSIEKNVCQIK